MLAAARDETRLACAEFACAFVDHLPDAERNVVAVSALDLRKIANRRRNAHGPDGTGTLGRPPSSQSLVRNGFFLGRAQAALHRGNEVEALAHHSPPLAGTTQKNSCRQRATSYLGNNVSPCQGAP